MFSKINEAKFAFSFITHENSEGYVADIKPRISFVLKFSSVGEMSALEDKSQSGELTLLKKIRIHLT
jgi:hypothetical protein